jgi:RHS repeat-associated protein
VSLWDRIGSSSTTTQYWYLWEGQNLLAEYNASGQRQKRYAYLPGSYLPEQMADSTGTYTVHSDHLQTPTVLSNSQGTTVWSMQHVAFGQAWINNDPDGDGIAVEFNQRFPGQYYDQETGLNYNYFRDYDPAIGRYIQSDPIGLRGGLNTYAYVGNNPLKYIDPLGLWSVSVDLYSGVGGGGGVTVGYNESTGSWFGGGRVGFGVGGGLSLDVLDEGPKEDECAGSGGTKFGTFGNLGASAGPLGADYGFEGGLYSGGGDFSNGPSLGGTVNGFGGSGVSIGGAVGVQVIGF